MVNTSTNDNGIVDIGEVLFGKKVIVKAALTSLRSHRIKNGSVMTDGTIGDDSGSVNCVWFSKTVLSDLKVGNEYVFEGYLEDKYGRLALQKPTYVLSNENQKAYEPVPLRDPVALTYASSPHSSSGITVGGVVWSIIIIVAIAGFVFNNIHQKHVRLASGITCKDVTSIDYNWDNDVLCTRPDGSTFYTDYAGGNKYGYGFH